MNHRNRLVSLIATGALCALALVASPAQASVSPSATQAGRWLAGQLSGGLINTYSEYGNYDDYGLSLDVLFALQEADTQGPAQDAIISAMRKNILNYISYPGDNDGKARYAGASAKLLVAVQAAGKDAASFGGVDLVDTVEKSVTATGQVTDRDSDYGDYANMLGESFALQGLATAHSPKTIAVRDFVLSQQCKGGNFPLYFGDCSPDVDATTSTIAALSAARADGVAGVDSALSRAVSWLLAQQNSDGSFGGGTSTTSPNTNSTGLAASVLAANGKISAARKAALWTYKLQVNADSGSKLKRDLGAVALGPDQFAAGKTAGITPTTRGEWRRATAQAALGLIYLDPDSIPAKVVTKEVRSKPLIRTSKTTTQVIVHDPPRATAEATTQAGKLGQYLARQLSNGDHVQVKDGNNTYVDYELTADIALALRRLGQQATIAQRITAFLLDKGSIAAYVHGAPYEKKATYAKPLAELIITASLVKKPDTKALTALARQLAGLQQDDGSFRDTGKFADRVGDVERQALAVVALRMAGDTASADKGVEFIQDSQCKDGGFATILGVKCATGDAASTGWALQALESVDASDFATDSTIADAPSGWDPARTTAIASAVESLDRAVHLDGSVDGTDGSLNIPATAAAAGGRQAAGLDTHAASVLLASLQSKDGGLPKATGSKKSDLVSSISAAPVLGASSLLSIPGSDLTSAVSFPVKATAPAVHRTTSSVESSHGLSISRPLAYTGGAVFVIVLIALIGLVAARLKDRGVSA